MICVNARFLTQGVTGVQRFATEISCALASMRDDLLFLCPRDAGSSEYFERLNAKCIGSNSGHAWEQFDLPRFLGRSGRPLLLNLCNTAPLFYADQVVTHHDVTYVRHPESYSRAFSLAYRATVPVMLRNSRALITVSDFSRREIQSVYGYPSNRIAVVPNAVGDEFRPLTERSEGAPYLLAVSSPSRHKNFQRLIDAFKALPELAGVELRIVGGGSRNFADTGVGGASKEDQRIRFLGRVSDADLVKLYQRATALVFPSLYEGFGIPPLEAMACGCPVIASDIPPVREVLGEAAFYFQPTDTADIARAIRAVVCDAGTRARLILNGGIRARGYSWQESASRVGALLDELSRDRGSRVPVE